MTAMGCVQSRFLEADVETGCSNYPLGGAPPSAQAEKQTPATIPQTTGASPVTVIASASRGIARRPAAAREVARIWRKPGWNSCRDHPPDLHARCPESRVPIGFQALLPQPAVAQVSFTPSFFSIHPIGQTLVKPNCSRLAPTKAVNHSQ